MKRRLDDRFGHVLLAPAGQRQDTTELRVRAGDVTDVLTALHDDPELRFDLLADLGGVDTGETMQVVYHLWSPLSPDWVRVIADGLSRDDPRVPSVTFLWPGAEWAEREAYDMFGIIFEGNRDLRRIYLQPDFQSFPLRKDFLLADDAARSPGLGVRAMEQPSQPAETRRQPVLRRSPGTGALIGSDGQLLVIAAGSTGSGSEPGGSVGGGGETGEDRPVTDTATRIHSLDDPQILVDSPATIVDAIPPYPPRTEREAEFYTLRDGEMLINLGPQHPSTHGVLRVVLKIDGERIVDLDPVLGYLHRGVEKIVENGDWHHAISNCDPLEYIASMFSEAIPVLAAEKLLDLEVPRRADYIRVLAWELNRISSHALFIGWLALDLGGLTPILWGFAERDEIVEMLAALTGQRLLFNYLRIGGVNGDLNHEFMSRLGDWMSHAGKHLEDEMKLLNENEIFVGRTRGLGVIDREMALRTCLTGPVIRATGVPYDVRRSHPYSVYPELDFEIPTRSEGDSYARYMLHFDEIKQSIRIIDQVLHQMPDGPVMAKLPRLLRVPPGRAWVALESPRGQYGAYAISDGSDQPFRLRIHDPSFFNLQAVGEVTPGNLIADIMAIMSSLDPIMGGVDK